jgi:cobalt/nickel transport system permease protein
MKKDIKIAVVGLGAAFVLVLLSPLASAFPDGLEKTAEVQGFADKAGTLFGSLMADYSVPGINSSSASGILAGLAGVVIVFCLAYLFGKLLAKNHKDKS